MYITSQPEDFAFTSDATIDWIVSSSRSSSYSETLNSFGDSTTQVYVGESDSVGLSPAEWIVVLVTPIIVVFGTIGNLMSVTVLLRPKFRSQSISVYLLCLAFADTAFLWTNSMTRTFIKICWGVDFSVESTLGCLAYVYMLYVSKCLSAWFIVAVTIERLLVVVFPYNAKKYSNRRRCRVVVLLITLSVFAMYAFIPYMGLYDVTWVAKKSEFACEMGPVWKERHLHVILKTLDLLMYSLFPTVILTFSNSVLIYKLVQSVRFRRANSLKGSRDMGARRLTIMLTLVSSCFLVFTLPMSSFLLYAQINTRVEHFEIFYRSFYVLELLNSTVNFILYCASGPAFRAELTQCVRIGCARCVMCKGRVSCTSCERNRGTCRVHGSNNTPVIISDSNTDLTHSLRQCAMEMVWTTSVGKPNSVGKSSRRVMKYLHHHEATVMPWNNHEAIPRL